MSTHNQCLKKRQQKTIIIFHLKINIFTAVKYCCILHKRVFVMVGFVLKPCDCSGTGVGILKYITQTRLCNIRHFFKAVIRYFSDEKMCLFFGYAWEPPH